MTGRHIGYDEATFLAQMAQMHPTFARMRTYMGGDYGVAVLTRDPPIEVREFHYHEPGKAPSDCKANPTPRDYCQGCLAVKLQSGVWFATTHVGLNDMQVDEVTQLVTEFLPTLDGDVFVTGDYNSVPESAAVMKMLAGGNWTDTWAQCGQGDGFTFNSEKPFERIDYIFQRSPNRFTCKHAWVPDTQASDHRPVVADFQ